MTLTTSRPKAAAWPKGAAPEPTWEVAHLFPAQGTWTVEEYLELKGNRLVEFSNGIVEVLAMPTMIHQLIAMFLSDALRDYVRRSNSERCFSLRSAFASGKTNSASRM